METLDINDIGSVRLVELNRPDALNALNGQMAKELAEMFASAAIDDSVKVIVLTGKGRAFWAGADLKEPAEARAEWFGRMMSLPLIYQNPF